VLIFRFARRRSASTTKEQIMAQYTVQIAETRNFEIVVDAPNPDRARVLAMQDWRNAPDVSGYEIPDTETEVVAITERPEPTAAQLAAVRAYATEHGRTWKRQLLEDWMTGRCQAELQQLRNAFGPSWLAQFRL
jgi:hypothetical protein